MREIEAPARFLVSFVMHSGRLYVFVFWPAVFCEVMSTVPGGAMNVADASETSGRKLVNGTWSESNSTWCVDGPSANGTPTPWTDSCPRA